MNNIILDSSNSFVDKWQAYIAKEVVKELNNRMSANVSLPKFCKLLNIEGSNDFQTLWLKFETIVQNTELEDIGSQKEILNKAYLKTITLNIESKSSSVSKKYKRLIKQFIDDNLQKASPKYAMFFLKDISKTLLRQRQNLLESIFALKEKIDSIDRAYIKLCNISSGDSDRNSTINALRFYYRTKFEKEHNLALSKVIPDLLRTINHYYVSSQKSFKLLTRLEISLSSQSFSSKEAFLMINCVDLNIDINYQQLLIDVWLNRNIIFWGDNTNKSLEDFEHKILRDTSNIAKELLNRSRKMLLEAIVNST